MPAALIIQLLATFGPSAIQLITTLIAKAESSGTVTASEWAILAAQLNLSASDHMTAQLKAAGIDPLSPQGQAMLGLTK